MKKFEKIFFSMIAMIMMVAVGSVFTSCSNDDDDFRVPAQEAQLDQALGQDSITTRSMNTVVYTLYSGVPTSTLDNYYGHIFQDRTFVGWKNENNYFYVPNNSGGHPYTYSSYSNLSYENFWNGNCGLAAYVMARAIAYPSSMFGLTHGYQTTQRKKGAKLYCETSMRLHREINSYNFTEPWMKDIYEGLAAGTSSYISDQQYILNPLSATAGATSGFVSPTYQYPKTDTGKNQFKTELETCLAANKPFMCIVGINPASHPIQSHNIDRQDVVFTEDNFPYSTDLTNTNYLKGNGSGHYIVVVGMLKAFGPTWDDFLPDETVIKFIDPYWNAEIIWETSYTKLVNAAVVASNGHINGFGFR